jgi:predicted lipoprotein with Yx(FWY)xxD motif
MFSVKRAWMVAVGALAVLAVVGCASANPYGGSGGTSTPTSTSTSTSGPTAVAAATATVGGKSETILTDAQGRTLYFFDLDTSAQSACTGACTSTWPPLLAPSTHAQGPSGLPGTFQVANVGNGPQVEYNGHPLYIYSGDTAPGQTTGDGIEGKWHVATPNIPNNSNGGGNGY